MLKTPNSNFWKIFRYVFSICLLMSSSAVVFAQSTGAKPATAMTAAPAKTAPTRSATIDSSKTSQAVIDPSLPDDPAVLKMLEPYSGKVRALDVVIGRLDGELRKGGYGGGTLGNFVTDGMRAQGRARLGVSFDLAVSNSGGLRKNSFAPGDLHVRDMYELLPFENALIEVELTGDQLMKVLQIGLENREPQSGARVKYKVDENKKPSIVSAVLIGADGREKPIVPTEKYRVITIDYLLSVAGGKFAILQESPVKKPLGVTIRDAMIDYIKSETAAGRTIKAKFDGRFRREGPPAADDKEPQ